MKPYVWCSFIGGLIIFGHFPVYLSFRSYQHPCGAGGGLRKGRGGFRAPPQENRPYAGDMSSSDRVYTCSPPPSHGEYFGFLSSQPGRRVAPLGSGTLFQENLSNRLFFGDKNVRLGQHLATFGPDFWVSSLLGPPPV